MATAAKRAKRVYGTMRKEWTEKYDYAVTAVTTNDLTVNEYVGYNQYFTRRVRPGARVTVTYYAPLPGGGPLPNCGVYVHRKTDNAIIDRDFIATPAAVFAATGIDIATLGQEARDIAGDPRFR